MSKKKSYPVFCAALLASALTISPLSFANEHSSFIPADTFFYVGTGDSIAIEDMFALLPDFAMLRKNTDSPQLDSIGELLEDPVAALADWGIEDNIAFSVYTVGFSPVLRVSISDAEKFSQALKAYEVKRQLESEVLEQDDWTINLYSTGQSYTNDSEALNQSDALDSSNAAASTGDSDVDETSNNSKLPNLEAGSSLSTEDAGNVDSEPQPLLVIGVSEKYAVVGFVNPLKRKSAIQALLGITKPEQSFAENDKLSEMRRKWGYGAELAAFIDFQQIAAVLTNDANPVHHQLQESGFFSTPMLGYLEQLRSEPCKSELTQLVSNWPMIVAGYRKFDVSGEQVEFDTHAAVIIGHEQLKQTLLLLRGMLPSSQSSSEPMLSLELGLTVDSLAQALGQLNEMAATVRYQCQVLNTLNAIAASDLSAVSMGVVMFGGMARGVRGMSVNIFDTDIDPTRGPSAVKSIDSAIAIAADDPAMLIGTLKMLPQAGALADLPLDGSEIDVTSVFPFPLPEAVRIKAAIKGNNVVLFSGEKSTDFANRLAQSQSELFFQGRANTRLILEKLTASLASSSAGDAEKRERVMGILDQYLQGELSYSIEFTDNGIEVVSKGLVDRRDPSKKAAR